MTSVEELAKQIRSKIIESTSPSGSLLLNYIDTWDEAWLEDLSLGQIEINIKLVENETQNFNDRYQIVYENELTAVQRSYADDFKKEIDTKLRKLTSELNKIKGKKNELKIAFEKSAANPLDLSLQMPSQSGIAPSNTVEPVLSKTEQTSIIEDSALDDLEEQLKKLRLDVIQLPEKTQEIVELKEQLGEKEDLLREAKENLKKLQTDRAVQSSSLLKTTEENVAQLSEVGTVVTEQLKKAILEDSKEATEHRSELQIKRQELELLQKQNEETTKELNKANEALARAQLDSEKAEELRKELQNEALKREEIQSHLKLLEEERLLRIERFNMEIEMHEKVIEKLQKQQEKAPRFSRQIYDFAMEDATDGEEDPILGVKRNQPVPLATNIVDLTHNEASVPTRETKTQVKADIQFKLDKIELPVFDGDLTEWNSFKEIFTVLIHDNEQLSQLIKLHQLKSHLKGAALETIRGYQLTGSNYKPAWEDLQNRYNRTDNIIQEYIKKFIETPILQSHPPAQRIQSIINGTNQMIRALPGVGVQVNNWDPFISFVILSKLDESTRRDWQKTIGKATNVPIATLLDFLELRAREVQPTQAEHMYQMLQGKKIFTKYSNIQLVTKPKMFQINKQPNPNKSDGSSKIVMQKKCAFCKGPHALFYCEHFRKLRAKERLEEVKKLKLCFKCFGEHLLKDCPARDCPICNGKHNSLLCFQKEARDAAGPSNITKN